MRSEAVRAAEEFQRWLLDSNAAPKLIVAPSSLRAVLVLTRLRLSFHRIKKETSDSPIKKAGARGVTCIGVERSQKPTRSKGESLTRRLFIL